MRILHVSLGLPPLRTGGLTRYCAELMEAQAEHGYEIGLLYPGRFLPGKTRVKAKRVDYLTAFEVVNPLPVPLTYGVSNPNVFMEPCDNSDTYKLCIKKFRPDVIHIHSFQGIHKEFFDIAKSMGIPMFFTTHDYFPICPRCTLVNRCGESCSGPSAERCAECCTAAGMTLRKSRVMQSALYSRLKESQLVKRLGSRVKRKMVITDESHNIPPLASRVIDAYGKYLDYNKLIFSDFDVIAANSKMTERMYAAQFADAPYRLVPITHKDLNYRINLRPLRKDGAPVRMAYFGGMKSYKGFQTLCEAARLLHSRNIQFELDLYGDDYPVLDGIPEARSCGRIAPNLICNILRAHDVIAVPSICHETFGFVVLEALCEHASVVCSDAVGASELVSEEFVFKAGDSADLAQKLTHAFMDLDSIPSIPEDYPITLDEQVHLLENAYLNLTHGVRQ